MALNSTKLGHLKKATGVTIKLMAKEKQSIALVPFTMASFRTDITTEKGPIHGRMGINIQVIGLRIVSRGQG